MRRGWEVFLIVLGAVMYLFVFPHGIHGDASVRWEALQRLLGSGELSPMIYSYVHPLVSAPLVALGSLYKDPFWWVSRFNSFLILGLALFAARSLRRTDRETVPGEGRALTLLLLCAGMFPRHATDYYAEVFCTVLAVASIFFFQRGWRALAVLACALSVWNALATLFAGSLLLLYFALRSRRWTYLVAILLLPAGIALENLVKYGELYPSAYASLLRSPLSPLPYAQGPGFSYPLLFGLFNVFLSSGKGLLFFAPGLVALLHPGLWRKESSARELLGGALLYFLGLLPVYAKYYCWHGAAYWGPRFFLFASPLAACALFYLARLARAGALSLPWRIYWIVAVALSCWVGLQGVMFGTDFLDDCYRKGNELEFMCWYVPEYSALWRFFIVAPAITGRRVAFLVYFLLVAGTLAAPLAMGVARELRDLAFRLWRGLGPRSGWRA